MRYRCIFTGLGLLLSSLVFAVDEVDFVARIPNSRNFIISGDLFRETIECLEKLIEKNHTLAMDAMKTPEKTETDNTEKQKNNLKTEAIKDLEATSSEKANDTFSIRLFERAPGKKILAF